MTAFSESHTPSVPNYQSSGRPLHHQAEPGDLCWRINDSKHFGFSGQGRLQLASSEGADSSMIGWWKFDEGSGTTVADESGKGNNLSLSNISWTTGKSGSGISFVSGSDSDISSDIIGINPITFCGWVNISNTSTHYIISNGQFVLYTFAGDNNTYRLGFQNSGGGNAFSDSLGMQINSWNHICLTRNTNGNTTFYINGSISGGVDQQGGVPAIGYTSTHLGNRAEGDRSIMGIIDDFRIYTRILSSAEISAIYNGTAYTGPVTSDPGSGQSASGTSTQQTQPITSTPTYISSDPIPADRRIDWSKVGTENGIIDRSNICATLKPSSTKSQIESAISQCTNGVVYLEPGIFNVSSITFGQYGKSNVTLRGAGPDETIIKITGSDPCGGWYAGICVKGSDVSHENVDSQYSSNIKNWTAGYTKGTNILTLDSISGLTEGMFIALDQVNDSTDSGGVFINDQYGIGSIEGSSPGRTANGGKRSQIQFAKITSIYSGTNQIVIDSPLKMSNWRSSQNPQIWNVGYYVQGVGIEDMTIDNSSATGYSGIVFTNTFNSWITNVKSLNSNRNHVWLAKAGKVTIKNNYFYGTKNARSQSYGVEAYISTDNLIENNIFEHISSPYMGGGSNSGNVFSYNYITDVYFLNGEYDNFMQPGISGSHSAANVMNLFEGNITNGFAMDLFHGTGALLTAFRNRFIGYETYINSEGNVAPKDNGSPIQINAKNRLVNIVGNIIGKQGYHTKYEDSQSATPGDPYHSIYYLGYASCCEQANLNGVSYDPLVASTIMRWGNYDYVSARTRWERSEIPSGANPSSSLPSSLYLSSRPSFFYTPWGTPSWPPIGPDVSGYVNDIPAKLCFDHSQKNTDKTLIFDADNCYGNTLQPSTGSPLPPTSSGSTAQSGSTSGGATTGSAGGSASAGALPASSISTNNLITSSPVSSPDLSVCISPTLTTLRYGTKSSSVKELQNQLIQYGYLKAGYNTGYYGNLTLTALNKYKAAQSTFTSSCGTNVTTTTVNPVTPTNTTPTSSRLPSTYRFTTTLKPLTSSINVKNLQIFLNDQGFTVSKSGSGSKGNETNYFGPATKSALIRFQEYYKTDILSPYNLNKGTGYFGVSTMKKVNQILGR